MNGHQQLTLTPAPRARTSDPATSHQAARSVTAATITDTQSMILRLLRDRGLTDDELARLYAADPAAPPVSPSGLRTRRRELADSGLVRDSGRRRELFSGRMAIVWERP